MGNPTDERTFEWTDANIPAAEVDWLREDLKATVNPVIITPAHHLFKRRQLASVRQKCLPAVQGAGGVGEGVCRVSGA